ncbi:Methionyl-tRNA formyltransferase [subsurface metagenome]
MRVVFMGTPEFAVPALERLILNQYQVVAVYTRPDKPAGRGRHQAPPPVKRAALELGVPVVQPLSLKTAEAVAELCAFRPDIIVVAAYGQILPPPVLDMPEHGCINIHPSLLPKYRGASPVTAAILAGDDFTGVSLMLLDKGLDTGPVLGKAAVAISPWDSTGSLTDKLSLVAAQLLQEVLVHWLRGEITPQPQDEAGATYSSRIAKEDGEIDWNLPAEDIWRRVRAFNPWPGGYTWWRGRQIRVLEAVPIPGGVSAAGRVIALGAEARAGFGVGTGDGVLGVLRVQLEGKRALSAAEFLRGQREFLGAVLPSEAE